MPRKVRELIRDLEKAGFRNRGGRGSHRNFVHPNVEKPVTIAGRPGADARHYQEKDRSPGNQGVSEVRVGAKYTKIVEWSDEDDCFIGSCPELFYGGCHGSDEKLVFSELCDIIEETIELYREDGKPLPEPLAGRDFVVTLQNVA